MATSQETAAVLGAVRAPDVADAINSMGLPPDATVVWPERVR